MLAPKLIRRRSWSASRRRRRNVVRNSRTAALWIVNVRKTDSVNSRPRQGVSGTRRNARKIMTPAVEAANSDAVCMAVCLAPCDETLKTAVQKMLQIILVTTGVVDEVDEVVEVAVTVDLPVPYRETGHARA